MLSQPAVHDGGVDAVVQGHCGDGGVGMGAGAHHLELELRAVEPAFGGLGGVGVARYGVHGVHHAHYLCLSAGFQWGFAGRVLKSALSTIITILPTKIPKQSLTRSSHSAERFGVND